MKSVIIGIHGLGNKPSEAILRSWWLNSIQEGMYRSGKGRLAVPFELAYWADVIHPVPLDPSVEDPNDPLFLKEHYTPGRGGENEVPPGFLKDLMLYLENQMDRIFLNADLSINFKKVTDRLIHHYFSDLEAYYGEKCVDAAGEDCSAREAIQGRLLRKLEQYRDYRIMLIAHSMGSIVAYDVLSSLDGRIPVHTFVTIGSPLGIPVIVGRVHEARKRRGLENTSPSVPEGITGEWVNMSDIRDRIAIDHTLEDDYQANSLGVKALDLYVHNDYEMNGKENPHKSFGYLRAPEMVGLISRFSDEGRSWPYRRFQHFAARFMAGIRSLAGAART